MPSFIHTHARGLVVFAGIAVALGLWWLVETQKPAVPEAFRIGDRVVSLEIADTEFLRQRGLSGRDGLAPGTGMLFVFDEPGKYAFWMREMLFPIDILWIDEHFSVVFVEPRVAPDTYPELFTPTHDAFYVLELPAGEAKALGIERGTTLQPVFDN